MNIQALSLAYVDVHGHKPLGEGTINICADDSGNGFLYSKDKISNAIWNKGTKLETFIAYGCNIRGNTNSNGATFTYLLGSEIPDTSRLIYYNMSARYYNGGGRCEFSYSGTKGSWSDNRSNPTGMFDYDGDISYSGSVSWNSAKSRCELETQIRVRGWSNNNNNKQIICYPFGM